MEWSYPGRTPPPRLSNASLERMINMLSLLASPPPPSKSNTYLLQHRLGHLPNHKVTLTKNKNKNKTTLAFSYICISAFIHPGYHGDRYGFFITLYRHLCGNFLLSDREPVCTVRHMRKHWGQFQVTCDFLFFFFFFFRMCHPNPFSTDSVMMSKVNDYFCAECGNLFFFSENKERKDRK